MGSFRQYLFGAAVAAAALSHWGAQAGDRHANHDAVRLAVQRGEVRPLADIVAGLRGKLPGEIVGVEVERKDGRWVYEFRVVDGKGRLLEAYVDGSSGEITRIKEK